MNELWDQMLDEIQEAAHDDDRDAVKKHAEALLREIDACEGENPESIAESLNVIALSQEIVGDVEGATEVYTRLINRRKTQYGPESLQTALSLKAFGTMLESSGQHGQAMPVLSRSADLLAKHTKRLLYHLGIVLDSASECLRKCGQLEEALESAEKSVDCLQRAAGSQYDLTLINPLRNQVLMLRAMGDDSGRVEQIEARVDEIISGFGERGLRRW